MNKKDCRAKDPNFCRYHSREAYKRAIENLEAWEKSLGSSNSFERTEEVKQYIARYSLLRDATETGFKKLDKEYRKTIVRGTDEEKANVSIRLRQATELRQTDDCQDLQTEWQEAGTNYEKLASYVIENAEKTSVVKMPLHFTGTMNIIGAASFMKNAGYEITDFEGNPADTINSSMLSPETVKKAVMDNLGKRSSDEVTEFAVNNNFYVQGLTFKNKQGKEVKLRGSWELTHELRYGKVDSILHIPRKTDEDYEAARKRA
jgi:hypothetical protein